MKNGEIVGVTCNEFGTRYMGVMAFRELSIGDKNPGMSGAPKQNDFIKIKKKIYDPDKKEERWVDDIDLMKSLNINRQTSEIEIRFLTNRLDRAFYCQYAAYHKEGSHSRLWCYGDGREAVRWDKNKDEWVEIECKIDCPFRTSRRCGRHGQLIFMVPGVTGKHYIFRMVTGSYHSIKNISRTLAFVDCQKGRIADLDGTWHLFIQKEATYTKNSDGKMAKRPHNIWHLSYEPATNERFVDIHDIKNYTPDVEEETIDEPINAISENIPVSSVLPEERVKISPQKIYKRMLSFQNENNILDEELETARVDCNITDLENMTIDNSVELKKCLEKVLHRRKIVGEKTVPSSKIVKEKVIPKNNTLF